MNPFAQLLDILVGLYITIILLRFFLQYFRADFYNPLSQFVVKATDPFIKPLRKIIPGFASIDVSSLLLAYMVILIKTVLLNVLSGYLDLNIIYILLFSIVDLLQSILRLFTYLILIRIILSWISPPGHNPILAVIGQISEPVIAKFRKILPPMGGFDFSPMFALLLIFFLQSSLNYYVLPVLLQIG
ncbi:MAG: YggT family protein [Kangiellaceae bacterium]|nr:YggT family protein [Kangiellaceae bacterium]